MKYYIENFGCQMNEHDMEKVNHLLHSAGHEQAPEMAKADLVIVNTCCIREKAEQKFYSRMGRLRAVKRRSGIMIGVTGCIAQLEKETLIERLPFVNFALGPSNIDRVCEAVEAVSRKEVFLDFSSNGCTGSMYIRPGQTGKEKAVRAYVTIMKGCDNYCSYCIVPYVRGREASRESGDILEEIRELAGRGIKEVILLGQNVNSYNRGREDMSFPELLDAVDEIEDIERVRFVTSHPKDLSPALIERFGRLRSLCEQIHLPFQSGSDTVLRLMNRGYTVREYRAKVELLKKTCPEIAISSDCIVGFPGEEETDFEETMQLVEDVRFDGLFSFCFSPRKYTAAAGLSDRVPEEVSLERLHRLQAVQKAITQQGHQRLEGKRVEVLVEGVSKNSRDELAGRTRSNSIVNFKGNRDLVGKLVEVDVVRGYANSARGANPVQIKEA